MCAISVPKRTWDLEACPLLPADVSTSRWDRARLERFSDPAVLFPQHKEVIPNQVGRGSGPRLPSSGTVMGSQGLVARPGPQRTSSRGDGGRLRGTQLPRSHSIKLEECRLHLKGAASQPRDHQSCCSDSPLRCPRQLQKAGGKQGARHQSLGPVALTCSRGDSAQPQPQPPPSLQLQGDGQVRMAPSWDRSPWDGPGNADPFPGVQEVWALEPQLGARGLNTCLCFSAERA